MSAAQFNRVSASKLAVPSVYCWLLSINANSNLNFQIVLLYTKLKKLWKNFSQKH